MAAERPFFGLVPGILLVSLGAFLLLKEFSLIPASVHLLDLWPLVVVAFGLKSLIVSRRFSSALFSLAFLALGSALLAGNLGLIGFPIVRLWPLLFVILGLSMLFGARGQHQEGGLQGTGWHDDHEAQEPHLHHGSYSVSDDDTLDRQITLSGTEIKVESQSWRGGFLGVTAGGVEIDLRNASLARDGATLELKVAMGGVDIRVPSHFQVICDVNPLLGGVDDSTRSSQGLPDSPRLRILGSVIFGGVSVHN